MVIKNIFYGRKFVAQFKQLPQKIKTLAAKKEQFFKSNPLHPFLRLHQLKGDLSGLWSNSITLNYRLIFKRMPNGDIIFISIGKHDLYGTL